MIFLDTVDYQLPYEEYIHMNETNENKILDTLHRVVVHDRKRPIIHQTTNMNSVYSLPSLNPDK